MKRNQHHTRYLPTAILRQIGKIARIPSPQPSHHLEKIDESLTPNMRALRMTMTIAEYLLSMGVSARDTVNMSQKITKTYCTRPVHLDISSTLITVSQDRGIDREPLTLVRTIVLDDANYQLIQALQSLAMEIADTNLPLHLAEEKLQHIVKTTKQHNRWLIYTAGGAVSSGVVVMYDSNLLMTALAFMMGFLATGFLRWMARIGVATFYSQIMTALLITLLAASVAWLNQFEFIRTEFNATMLVISGIVLLVAGMMMVGAFQDAIDEYYVTANARLLKVMMATGGIVIGVMAGLYIATRFGITFPTTPDRLTLAPDKIIQYLGALLTAAAFAVRNHSRWLGLSVAGAAGMLSWWISLIMTRSGFGIVLASATAATIVGFVAVLTSRFWRFPSMAIIAAGIVPLVPGLSLYNGMLGVVLHPPSDPLFMSALAILLRATMIGLAVAAGASLGNMIGRPIRRRVKRIFSAPGRVLSPAEEQPSDIE